MKCKWCGNEFESIYPRQTHCSAECSKRSKAKWQVEYERRKSAKAKEQKTEKKEKKTKKQKSTG